MAIKAETSFSLKDQLFNEHSVAKLGAALAGAKKGFRRKAFERDVLAGFPERELKERISWMVEVVARYLPKGTPAAMQVLRDALPEPLDPTLRDDDFGEFIWSVPAEYVALRGCNDEYLEASLEFLREATMRFSVENAIRPFLAAFPAETMDFIRRCATDENYHVRRLASEGIRPYLPWAMRINIPREDVIDVLSMVHGDGTRYVTRSVANCLNDISRDDPDLVMDALADWHKAGQQDTQELAWMTRHALRTCLKRDNTRALAMLGFPPDPSFRLSKVEVPDVVEVGGALTWQGTLSSQATQNLRLSLRVYFRKANGKLSPNDFAIGDLSHEKGEKADISKKVPIRPATTRTLYPGEHAVELIVNGVARARRTFELKG